MNKTPQPPKPARRILGLFAAKPVADTPIWFPERQLYPRVEATNISYGEEGAVYALWHLGVRPQWLRVGAARNLSAAVPEMAQVPSIAPFANAGLFLAWTRPPIDRYAGIVRFLAARLAPALQAESFAWDIALDPSVAAIDFALPPGTREP